MILTQLLNRAAAKRQRGFFWLLIFFMDHVRQVMIKTSVADIVFRLYISHLPCFSNCIKVGKRSAVFILKRMLNNVKPPVAGIDIEFNQKP